MNQGDTIASYQLEAPLNELRHGAWQARHMVNGQIFRLDLWATDCDAQEYVREMKAVASLRHQHISSILEFGLHTEGLGWTISRFLTGKNVSKTLEERGQPAYRTALELCFVVARALETAHGQGVYHGSLNLDQCTWIDERILLTGWGEVSPPNKVGQMRVADITFLGDLVSKVTRNPPAPLKALMESPPRTSGAYRRALAAALGAVSMSDRAPLVPSPERTSNDQFTSPGAVTVESGSSMALALSESELSGSYVDSSESSANVDPVAPTDEHTIETMAALTDWGIGKEDEDPEWIDTQREEIRTSNQYAPEAADGDSWGVGLSAPHTAPTLPKKEALPGGMRIHTVGQENQRADSRFEKGRSSSSLMWVLAALTIIAGLLWYGYASKKGDGSLQIDDRTQITADERQTNRKESVSASVNGSENTSDGGRPAVDAILEASTVGTFELRINTLVQVVRVSDGKVICKEAAICPVSIFKDAEKTIDTHYRLTSPKFQTKLIKGYEIHDIRMRRHMRVVMAPKEAKRSSRLKEKNAERRRKKKLNKSR